ncbi:MAG: UDP-4-amino-4,6-dideoxy-N-acetyl-beta-L-altrosamine transaminase [Candidatus Omnitrophica bacterium]|nr:UDP-4-amino-4,6-dideoxy-N-acetyl-beta-L-altrosamine transaminase [Candidatus Omnitrophota bacterium]
MNKTIPYGKHWINESDIQSVVRVLRGDWITQGPFVSQFENQFARQVKASWAVAVSSGTAGLHLAVLAQNLKRTDEVLVPAITFVATANAVFYAGAKPRIVDVDPQTGNISIEDLKRKINKNTRGIIPVHFAGNPVDLKTIRKIARKHKMFVIEDCCHALGAEYDRVPVGSSEYSDLSVFSFHPVKHITTGEGGMITGNSKLIQDRFLKFRSHGITRNPKQFLNGESGAWYYEQQELGFNYRITDFQCALGMSQLKRLKSFVAKRRRIAEKYRMAFRDWPEIECLSENPDGKSSYHLFVVRVSSGRGGVFEELRKRGIGVQVHYIPLHYHPYFKKRLALKMGQLPGAESFYEEIISLPIYPQLSSFEQDRVIQTLRYVLTQYQKRR